LIFFSKIFWHAGSWMSERSLSSNSISKTVGSFFSWSRSWKKINFR
jgi:hypothetical protein